MITKKIYVERNDTLSAVVDKIIAVPDEEIILYVPRSTKFGSSPSNFRLLKRELDSAGKMVEIESVDDTVLEMAKMIGFKSVNPFFKKNHKQISDIVRPGEAITETKHKPEEREVSIADDPEPVKEKHKPHAARRSSRNAISTRHKIIGIFAAAAVLIGGYLAVFVLPEAKIQVSMENIQKDFNGSLYTGALVKANEFTNNTVKIKGVFAEETANITKTYPATGTELLNAKATGTITIYNAYSSSTQSLVTGTRFEGADGKIFRLTKSIIVPGAKTVNGKLVPSSIKGAVQADVAGAEYNIGPTHFTIPGFKGTPKYAGFYGDSESVMSGGIVGKSVVATESDIKKAKEDIHKTLEDGLRLKAVQIPDIKIIPGAAQFTVTKEDINKIADGNGNFRITSYGLIQSIGFYEADIRAILGPQMIDTTELELGAVGVILKDSFMTYGEPRMDFGKKDMSVSLKFHSSLRRSLDTAAFKKFVSGKRASDLSTAQLPFPGIDSLKMRLWPFWVKTIPTQSAKVTVDVQ